MTELNTPACPTHGSLPRALHTENFEGIVTVVSDLIETVSGVGTTSYSRCPYGYPSNFEGVVRVLEDLNTTISGIRGDGSAVAISGAPGTGYRAGQLWFDTNQGRLLVYASGNGVTQPDWYQTNAEALANISQYPPSGTGLNAPARDGVLWFNTLLGTLFIYDATSSGWYETQRNAAASYGAAAPAPDSLGSIWYDTGSSNIRVWDGTTWTTAI